MKAEYKTNALYYYANNYRKFPTEEDQIETIDMTETFWKELEYMVEHNEIIIMNINAKMRLGKSTAGMAIGQKIFEILVKHGRKPKKEVFGIKNICRDEQEHSKMMRDPNTENTVMVIDESNELEKTGENVTAENALRKVFSDVMAGRYCHAVYCSPKETTDDNADIQLNVISVDKRKQTTRAKLYYRFNEGGMDYTQLLGYVDIDVSQVLNKKWYKEYERRKFEKMELITKEGIMRPRTLDYAKVILKAINQLKKLTQYGSILNSNIVKNYIKAGFREEKIPTSMIGEKFATDEAMGVLDMYKAFYRMIKQIEAIRKKVLEGKMDNKLGVINEHNLTAIKDEIMQAIKLQMEELEKYAIINEKYHTVKE